jgi:hypothetical protein
MLETFQTNKNRAHYHASGLRYFAVQIGTFRQKYLGKFSQRHCTYTILLIQLTKKVPNEFLIIQCQIYE